MPVDPPTGSSSHVHAQRRERRRMTWVDAGRHEQPAKIGAVIFHVGPAGTSVTYDLPGHDTAEAHAEVLRIVRAAVVGDLRAAGKDGAVQDRVTVPIAVAAVLRRDGSLYWPICAWRNNTCSPPLISRSQTVDLTRFD